MSDQSNSDPLPYTQVDRAVKPKATALAGLMGVTTQHALGSLVEFWELCGDPRELERLLEQGIDRVVLPGNDVKIRFRLASGGHEIDLPTMVALGLLAPHEDLYRVRGMSRYFEPIRRRIQARKAAKAGGLASVASRRKANGTAQPRSGAGSEVASESVRTTPEALPKRPRSEHRSGPEAAPEATPEAAPNTAVSGQRSATSLKKLAGKPPPDPRHAPLVKALVDACPGYAFTPRDAKAVTQLLALGEPAEVETRWRRAISRSGYPLVRAIHELPDKWPHFAADSPPTGQRRGVAEMSAVDRKWHAETPTGEIPDAFAVR